MDLKGGFHYLVWASLELTMWTRLESDSQIATCLCLQSPMFKGRGHHDQLAKCSLKA